MDLVVFPRVSVGTPRRATALRVGLLVLSMAVGASAADLHAQGQPDPLQLLKQLNEVQIDPAQIYFLRDTQVTRDRANIYFNRGFIGFLTPVAGEITGAVFEGDGEILLIPPSPTEKINLARFTGSPILTEKFTFAYLRFTDQTAKELLAHARQPDPDDVEQPTGFLDQWNPTVRLLSPDYSVRILQDLLGDRTLPYFHSDFQTVEQGIIQLSVDERLPEAVQVGAAQRSHGELFNDLWCSFPSGNSEAKEDSLRAGPASVRSYKIDTQILEDHSLVGRAELELRSNSSADPAVLFELSRSLKVTEVKDERGNDVTLIQNPSLEESETAARGNDWVLVILPAPVPRGQTYRLSFSYRGNVITEVGNDVLYVGARGSWYPNRGVGNRATYDLTFQYPERLTLVATGNLVEEHSSGGWKYSHWTSPGEFAVAGFNLGVYDSRRRKAGDTLIEVYASREAEGALENRNVAAQPAGELVVKRTHEGAIPVGVLPIPVRRLDPAAELDSMAGAAAEAVQYFAALFGPFPYPRLAISQAPGHFGQGWPGLVYLPTLSFLGKGERAKMGLAGGTEGLRSELSVAHEIAHQWWGNRVGWKTYHDQWLSEGFATYAAALNAAREKDGARTFREIMQGYKKDLLEKTSEGGTVESGGPIWLGHRLKNSRNRQGFDTIVYEKSCWVLHMLRELMADPKTGSDDRFFRMLREFATSNWDREVSTQDFARQAQKYMTPDMDLEGDGRLDWFFSTWVYGVGIPTYKLRVKTREAGPRKFIVEGDIAQSNVPAEFEMMVPLVAESATGKRTRLGLVRVTEDGGKFRFTMAARPSRVLIDEDNVLAVVD
jgi:hypothetical protein